MSRSDTLDLKRLKLHLGKNTYEGHDSVLESVKISYYGKSYKYDVDDDNFFSLDLEKATSDIIKYDGEELTIDAEHGEEKLGNASDFRPVHLDRNTGKLLELDNDFTRIEYETKDGEIGVFRVQDLYAENAKNGYPIDIGVMDHMILKMHSAASTNAGHEIVDLDVKEILVEGVDVDVLQDLVSGIAVE